LYKGNKSLYYYNFEGKDNFYIEKDSCYELLEYKKYLEKREGKSSICENRKYIRQLAFYLMDCAVIQSNLKNVSYTGKSLKNLFRHYSDCVNSTVVFENKTEKIIPEFGILFGITLSSLEFKGDKGFISVNTKYPKSTNIAGGLFCDFVLPKNQKKWSIYNELMYTSFNVSGSYKENENNCYYTTLAYSYLKINNMLRYRYPIENFSVFLNVGMSNGYVVKEKNYSMIETKINNQTIVSEGAAINGIRKYEEGIIIGTGLKYKRFSFDCRYERGTGMTALILLKSVTQRYYFLLGYKF
jgi:hypothetical protein